MISLRSYLAEDLTEPAWLVFGNLTLRTDGSVLTATYRCNDNQQIVARVIHPTMYGDPNARRDGLLTFAVIKELLSAIERELCAIYERETHIDPLDNTRLEKE